MSVETLIADARNYATNIIDDAELALFNAQILTMQVGYEDPVYTPFTTPAPPPSAISLTLPAMDTVTLDLPVEPNDILTFQDISELEVGDIPVRLFLIEGGRGSDSSANTDVVYWIWPVKKISHWRCHHGC